MERGQIWIETVIYTLIGLALIGIVLALVVPKVNEYRDRAAIEQTISSLNLLDAKINEVLEAPGNTRVIEFNLKRGALYVNDTNDSIYFEIVDSHSLYSEPNVESSIGRIKVLTKEGRKLHTVRLTLVYEADIVNSDGSLGAKKFSAASTPYRLSFTHAGFANRREIINFTETSEG